MLVSGGAYSIVFPCILENEMPTQQSPNKKVQMTSDFGRRFFFDTTFYYTP